MNREYTIEEFSKVAEHLTRYVHNMTLATDFIVGFPYETDEDHNGSMNLIRKFKFRVINISK